jgi:3-hydroxyisobutyrate dehydrogenase-like beta-hydroxyacid dehydrogenase
LQYRQQFCSISAANGGEHAGEPTRSLVVTTVAVLGLGEAGSRLAADLVTAGAGVHGYDPLAGTTPEGVVRRPDTASTVAGCDVVLSLTTAGAALEAATAALPSLAPGAIYADLNTARPALKRELATRVAGAGGRFADVALLGPVPARGLGTPALASGAGAGAFADALGPLGLPVDVVSDHAGDATALKLLRSVFMKGLAASALESMAAAEAAGHAEWLEQQLADVIGRPLLERLLEGSRAHAARRVDEMEAARELVHELGVEPRIASASGALLAELAGSRGR